jgi:3-dehydroquinate dehydratase-1
LICATLLVERPGDLERALRSPVKCVEARLDPYRGELAPLLGPLSELARAKTLIITVRSPAEGGRFKGSEEDRLSVYLKALEAEPQYVDVELSADIRDEVVKAKGRAKAILSRHDFERTPDLETLTRWVREGEEGGADVVKIATTANSWDDNFKVLSLMGRGGKPVAAFAMGPLGVLSRVFAPLMGAPFTYAALDAPAAPGQLSYGAMEAIYSSLGIYSNLQSLSDMRAALDAVDSALMYLLKLRLEVCRDIGRLKKSLGLSVYDDSREAEVLKRAGDFKQLFDLVVQMCKAVQIVVPT